MDTFGALLLVLAANLDNLGVGISLGARKIRLPLTSNLLIALVTSGGTLLSLFAGRWLASFLWPGVTREVGATIITATGLWISYQELARARRKGAVKKRERKGGTREFSHRNAFLRLKGLLEMPPLADADYSGHIDVKEACLLGGALTLNNFAGGFGAGVFGLDAVLVSCAVIIFSLFFLGVGIRVGQNCLSRWLGEWAGVAGGLLLVTVGVAAFFI